jgi:hypothetical protein
MTDLKLPEKAPAEPATALQLLLDTEERRDFARALVRVWHARVDSAQACHSLAHLVDCMDPQRADEIEHALNCRPDANAADLAAALRRAASLAIKIACGCCRAEMRSLCVRLATRCEADASRVHGQMLWQEPATGVEPRSQEASSCQCAGAPTEAGDKRRLLSVQDRPRRRSL